MKINKRGQVTIPAKFRRTHGLSAGTEVVFRTDGTRIWVILPEKRWAQTLVANMTGKGSVEMSTDEILNMTRGDW